LDEEAVNESVELVGLWVSRASQITDKNTEERSRAVRLSVQDVVGHY
jgi:hypothetical protein